MERNERSAVRGLRPETEHDRRHARILHALHSTRAHLHAARAALDQALESMAEADDIAEVLTATQGAEHYAKIKFATSTFNGLLRELHRHDHNQSLGIAINISDLMEEIRDLRRAQGWA